MQKDRFLALFGDYIEEHIRQNLSDGQVLSVVIERKRVRWISKWILTPYFRRKRWRRRSGQSER